MRVMIHIASLPEDELHRRQFPLGPGYLAAYLAAHEPDVEVRVTALEEEILAWRPDLLGISTVSQCDPGALATATRVERELGIPVVLGGYHVSALPSRLPAVYAAGVVGEGEVPFLELVRVLGRDGELQPAALAAIPGICYHDGDAVVVNPTPPPLDVDTLPHPRRNISRGARNITVFSSRGCAYRCKYCASSRHWGRLRVHSARYFVDELKQLVTDYDARSIYLLDDLFFADRRRVHDIAALLDAEGLGERFTFHGFITSNLAERGLLAVARRMGFRSLRFGAETGSDRLLKQMKGPWASVASHQRCIDLCAELGLEVSAAFMLGTPGETVDDLEATCAFVDRNRDRLRIDGLYLTTPVPGTPYWDLALQRGLVSETMDFARLNIDFAKERSFDLARAIYLNEENVPLTTLGHYEARIRGALACAH